MRVRVLGSAAGGGFPQWNCSCANCASVRLRMPQFKARSQSQLALCVDPAQPQWHLLNGSPDLRQQLLNFPDMLPTPEAPRSSPIQSMTITNADIDHTLGLLLLRESHRLCVYSSGFVRSALLEGNAYFDMLNQFEGQVSWRAVEAGQRFELRGQSQEAGGLTAESVALEGAPPFWAKKRFSPQAMPVMGLVIESQNGARLGYFPGVARVDQALLEKLNSCDVIFFDGTFWSDDEIQRVKGGSRSGRDMGHVSMSGDEGSLALLRGLPSNVQKFYIHINNTNPALDESGVQYQQLREAGWDLAFDGMELTL